METIQHNTTDIGTLKYVNPRDVWEHEARNFTPWLADHIDLLSKTIGMELTVLECEKSVGPFSADIYAEDEYGDTVVIENQLEKTDHDHLGKMFTYAACLDTKTMVWITPEARPEHAIAINRLNSMDDTSRFYLVEIRVIQIDGSKPAPIFSLICEPNEEIKTVRKIIGKTILPREKNWLVFWEQIKGIDLHTLKLHKNPKKSLDKPYMVAIVTPGITWDYVIMNKGSKAQLYINDNKDVYESIFLHKEEIESAFGGPLVWHNKENVKSCKISSESNTGGLNDTDKWGEIQYDMVDRMARLKEAIDPYLNAPHQH